MPAAKPTEEITSSTKVHAAEIDGKGIPIPPSSATKCVSLPCLAPRAAAASRIAAAHEIASANEVAPTGTTSTSWISRVFPACAPPDKILTIGIGISSGPEWEKNLANDFPATAASAIAAAKETAKVALAPKVEWLDVESSCNRA